MKPLLTPEELEALTARGITVYRGWQISRIRRSFYAWRGDHGERGLFRRCAAAAVLREIDVRMARERRKSGAKHDA